MSFDWNTYDQDIEKRYHLENFEDSHDEFETEEGGEEE